MDVQVDFVQHGDVKTYRFNWKRGTPPENNDELRTELDGLDDSLVYRAYGQTSLVLDLGAAVDLDEVLDIFRNHGYETSGIPLPDCDWKGQRYGRAHGCQGA